MDEKEQLENQPEEEKTLIPSEQPEDSTSRMNAAKAFFRALNAGESMETASLEQSSQTGNCPNCSQVEARIRQCEEKATEAESLYKRMAADFENYRRRMDREREEFLSFGVQKVVEALLPALDDLDRAKSSLNAEMAPEKLLQSMEIVYNRINQCLEQVGVKSMNAVGEAFDPKYHEPVQEIETTDFPDGSVMQELRRGYMINDKVVRPVLVNVAQNTGTTSSSKKGKGSKEKSKHSSDE